MEDMLSTTSSGGGGSAGESPLSSLIRDMRERQVRGAGGSINGVTCMGKGGHHLGIYQKEQEC